MMSCFNRILWALLVGILVSACSAKAPKPVAEIALADSAINSAVQAGAQEYAPVELRLAREKKQLAEDAVINSEYEKAKRLTDQARVDAEHARATAEAEKARRAMHAAQDNIQLLKHVDVDAMLEE